MADKLIRLNDIIKGDADHLTLWAEFLHGISLKIRYVPRHKLQMLMQTCMKLQTTKEKGRIVREKVLDPEAFTRQFCALAVVDWKGITPKTVSKIVPTSIEGLTPEQLQTEIPFSLEDLVPLVKNSMDLDNFIQETAMDVGLFTSDKEEVEGNSVSSQSGS
jgi:hypothetical protein